MRTSGDVQYIGGYLDACGGIMSISGDVQYIGVFNISQRLLSICSPT